MYSGTALRRDSGRIVGVHQKIDRIARRQLDKHIPESINFPAIKSILHFEGKNGPDGIKLKSPTQDEMDHSIDPDEPLDRALLILIDDHITNLTNALVTKNEVRAAFEAAWLAHAVVDGLTPAHHHPLNEKIKEILTKSDYENFDISYRKLSEFNRKDALMKKWENWGPAGVVSHVMFELGVASVITTDRYKKITITKRDLDDLTKKGFSKIFMESVYSIHELKMYDEFCKKGWTRNLAKGTRNVLMPKIIRAVTLAWYQSIIRASQ